jgi:hypothetical protein
VSTRDSGEVSGSEPGNGLGGDEDDDVVEVPFEEGLADELLDRGLTIEDIEEDWAWDDDPDEVPADPNDDSDGDADEVSSPSLEYLVLYWQPVLSSIHANCEDCARLSLAGTLDS